MNNLTGTTRENMELLFEKNKKIINEFINNWCPYHIQPDFKQDLYLILYEYPEIKMDWYIKNNLFIHLVVKIIKNQIKSSHSSYYKNYIQNKYIEDRCVVKLNGIKIENSVEDYESELIQKEQEYEQSIKNKNILQKIDNKITSELNINPKFIREKILWDMKTKEGKTYREIAKKTKIPVSSCFHYINKINNLIKDV